MPEGFFTRLGAVASAAGAIIGFLTWIYSWPPRSGDREQDGTRTEVPETTPINPGPVTTEALVPPTETHWPPPATEEKRPQEAMARPAERSLHLALAAGQQKVILSGHAALSSEFNQVGEMKVPTLRIQVDGGEPENYPLLNAGGRFEFSAAGGRYVASVESVDLVAETITVQVDPQ